MFQFRPCPSFILITPLVATSTTLTSLLFTLIQNIVQTFSLKEPVNSTPGWHCTGSKRSVQQLNADPEPKKLKVSINTKESWCFKVHDTSPVLNIKLIFRVCLHPQYLYGHFKTTKGRMILRLSISLHEIFGTPYFRDTSPGLNIKLIFRVLLHPQYLYGHFKNKKSQEEWVKDYLSHYMKFSGHLRERNMA